MSDFVRLPGGDYVRSHLVELPSGDYVRPEAVLTIRRGTDRVTITLEPEGFIVLETNDPAGLATQIALACNGPKYP